MHLVTLFLVPRDSSNICTAGRHREVLRQEEFPEGAGGFPVRRRHHASRPALLGTALTAGGESPPFARNAPAAGRPLRVVVPDQILPSIPHALILPIPSEQRLRRAVGRSPSANLDTDAGPSVSGSQTQGTTNARRSSDWPSRRA